MPHPELSAWNRGMNGSTQTEPGGDTGGVQTVVEMFDASASVLRLDDGVETTGSRLVDEGRRLAAWLAARGVERGDRVAVRLPNGPDYLRLLLACAAGGFVAVSVNTRYNDREAAELIARSGARPFELDDGWRSFTPADLVGGRDDPFVVFTTSGTTSRPKMVLHQQRSIADHAPDVAAGFGLTGADVVLAVMPFCGTFGLASLTGALAGGSRVVVANFDVERTAALIEDEQVTCVNGSDDMFHRLLEKGADLSSIRLGGYGRFNTSLDGIVERAAAAGAALTGLYGMSEVQALYSVRDPSLDVRDRERAGGTLVSPQASYRVVDDELQLRGPSLFAGYLAEGGDRIDDELTGRHFDDGWFRTGDLAEADDERTFHFLTRMGDVLRLGGFLVAPAEIESVLTGVDGIDAAQVVAVDRPTGARPVAFVVAPGSFDEAAAIERCRSTLARYKVPVRVLPINEFPTTASANGTKIQKVKLRELAEQALD
jgi:fatty-acyl-CoA synthase